MPTANRRVRGTAAIVFSLIVGNLLGLSGYLAGNKESDEDSCLASPGLVGERSSGVWETLLIHDKGICSKEHHIVESLLYSFDTAGFLRL